MSFNNYHHHHHIRLINDLSTASITQHKTHKTYNGNGNGNIKKNKCYITKNVGRRTGIWTQNVIDFILL